MIEFFHSVLYTPLYNLLVFLVDVIPGGDVGIAVVVTTLLVRFIVMPLSFSALKTQRAMRVLDPELRSIRERLKDNPQEQAREMFALYKKYNVKPFASFLTLLIQIPILIGLFWVFSTEALPQVDTTLLYSFVSAPETISPLMLGFFSVAGSSIILAIIAGITQSLQAFYAIPLPPKAKEGTTPSMQDEFARAMGIQARYVFPIIMAFVSFASGAIAIYFITSNLVSLIQEWFVRKMPAPAPTN